MRSRIETLEARRLFAASIEVSAVNALPSITDGDTTPSLDDGTSLGTDLVGGAPMLRSFFITNTSAADDLTLSNLTVPAGFTIEKALPDLLGPGSSAPFTIGLQHTAQQTRTGTLSFSTNVPGSESFDFTITATLAPAAVDGSNFYEDVPSFADTDFLLRGEGSDGNGLPVSSATNRLLRFNVPDGEAKLDFSLSGTPVDNGEATGDAEVLVLRDANGNGVLDLSELASPVTSFVDPASAGATGKSVTLEAATYFALLRIANFAPVDGSVEQPNAQVNYTLQATMTAIQPPAIEVTFGGNAVLDGDATPSADEGTQFGSATVGAASAPQRTFTIANPGGEPLELGAVSVPPGFELVTAPPATLAGGASASFTVRMLTTSAGAKSGSVSFATNVPDANPFNFAVAGTVTPAPIAEITVLLEGGGALVDGQSASVDFGSVVQGQTAPLRTLVVRNDGAAELTLGAVTLPAGFELTEGLPASLAPGASDAFTVTMNTASTGTRSGMLSIASGDADEASFDIPLRGVVTSTQEPGPGPGPGPGEPPVGEDPSTLAVNDLTSTVPATVVAGAKKAKGTVKFMLANTGTAATSGDAQFTVFASIDNVVDGADPVLLNITRRAKINAGRAKAIRLNVKFLPDAPAGAQTLLVRAVANGQTADGVGSAVTIEPPIVSLRGSTTPAAPLAKPLTFGKRSRISIPLRNDGNTAATRASATYRLIVSTDETTAGKVFETIVDGRITLKPGASKPQRLTATFAPGAFAAGSYTLIVQLESELNDVNEQIVALIPFTIA